MPTRSFIFTLMIPFTTFVLSSPASADSVISGIGDYVIVPDKDVIKSLAPAPNTTVPANLNVLVWNTHKGEDGNKWAEDLKTLSRDRHFVLLQEGMDDNFMPSVLKAMDWLGWLMGQSFYMKRDHEGTGVITGAVQNPFSAVFQRTKDLEPVVKTPKVTLFSTYTMEKGSRLLIVNIHGINFTAINPFYRQIDRAMAVAKAWKGKVIFAGDFNTWAAPRTDYLNKKAQEADLREVLFPNDPRNLVLDHVYLRGCYSYRSVVHGNINTSDHKPLTVDLSCPE